MKYFRLGKHKLSKYCLGTWSLGSDKKNNISYGNITQEKAKKILSYAYKKGINFFDTANVYGDAEKRLGLCFANIRKKVFIATKVGCISYNKKINLTKKLIKKQIITSLKNLKTNYLDLVQIYNPDPKDKKLKSCIEYLDKLKKKDVIKFVGVSLRQPEDYNNIRKFYKFDTVQCNFNILDHRMLENNIIEKLKKDNVKILVRTVLNFGIFTEKFLLKKKIKFKTNDHRYKWNIKQIINWKIYANKIKKLSKRKIENTCYKFCNSHKVSAIIIGANTFAHLDNALLKNNNLGLGRYEIKKIKTIYEDYKKTLFLKPKFLIK